MRILYLQCGMGASGDMLTSALAGLLTEEERAEFLEKVNGMGLPGARTERVPASSLGMAGLGARVTVNGTEEGHGHEDLSPDSLHYHHHHHHHEHHSLSDILGVISGLRMDDEVRRRAAGVYRLIAEAESAAHGRPVGEVHFHEVGAKDAVADIVSVCLLMKMVGAGRVVSSPVCVGSGTVRTGHGVLGVPVPAVSRLLEGVPCFGSAFPGELCTPTGAALIRSFADEFGPMPAMRPLREGCGIGSRVFPEPNCLRAILGETGEAPKADEVLELEANIDDMTPEDLGFARDSLLRAGALDAWLTPIVMKKGRAAEMISCLCRREDFAAVRDAFFRNTTTLGIRYSAKPRFLLSRRVEERQTSAGTVRVKVSEGFGVRREKAEFDDLAAAAEQTGRSLLELRAEAKGKP